MQLTQSSLHNGFSDLWPHAGIAALTEMPKLYERLLASGGVFWIDPELHSSVLDWLASRPNGSLPASFITAAIQINSRLVSSQAKARWLKDLSENALCPQPLLAS